MHLFAPRILHKLLLWNGLGNMQTSQEYFTTIVYANFGEQTECIMDNWKIVNEILRKLSVVVFLSSHLSPAGINKLKIVITGIE